MENRKKKIMTTLLCILTFLMIISAIMVAMYSRKKTITVNQDPLRVEDGVSMNDKQPDSAQDSHTEIPVYKSLTVSSKEPEILLGNPEINDVYFRYKVSLKEKQETATKSGVTINAGEKARTLYDNDAVIEPGRAFKVNLRDLLEPGTYTVTIDISTFDLETETPCNGATQEAELTVLE